MARGVYQCVEFFEKTHLMVVGIDKKHTLPIIGTSIVTRG